MNQIYQAPEYGDNNNNLGCTANEVSAIATHVEGPQTCTAGSKVVVNVTASLSFNADRYDVGLYTYTGSPEEYADDSAVFGNKCAFQLLGSPGQCTAPIPDVNGVYDTDNDECCDVVAQSGYTYDGFRFQDNLEVPCTSVYGNTNLVLQTCFSYRTSGNNIACQADGSLPLYSWPGSPSKCDCTFIFLDVEVVVSYLSGLLFYILPVSLTIILPNN